MSVPSTCYSVFCMIIFGYIVQEIMLGSPTVFYNNKVLLRSVFEKHVQSVRADVDDDTQIIDCIWILESGRFVDFDRLFTISFWSRNGTIDIVVWNQNHAVVERKPSIS